MNIFRMLLHHGRTQPHVPALSEADFALNYRELAEMVARTASHLRAHGLRPGERIGLCLKDHWHHVVLFIAAGFAGLVIVPMDWRARPAERQRIARQLALRSVLVEPQDGFEADCPVVTIDESWRNAAARADPLDNPPDDWHAPLIVVPTAGTTGSPRYTVASHLQFYFRTVMSADTAPRLGPRRYLSALPLCFSIGSQRCMTQLLKGDSVIMFAPLFTAPEYADAIARLKVQIAFALPSLVRQLLAIAPATGPLFPTLESLFCGGAPLLAEEKREAARRLTPNLYSVFGTSATGGLTRLQPHDIAARADSVGQPYPHARLEIVNENGHALPADMPGLVRARGPGTGFPVPLANETAPVEDIRDGWFYSGDIGALDRQGYLYLKGRSAEVIMRGGAKIQPVEIEAVLHQHEAVVEAAVIGRMVAGEEEVTAFVVTCRPVDTGELLAHCRGRLTAYKMPREIRVIAALPRNTAGKVAKLELAKLLRDPS
jgi:long-chain acyl-CoA synthetase